MTGTRSWRFIRSALLVGLPAAAVAASAAAFAQEPETPPPQAAATERPTNTAEWMALPIDDLRRMAHGGNVRAMEELGRRLVSGIGVPQDAPSGAGWLLRAAEAGSPGAAYNVGVMYERGFVVERDSSRAVEWYRKAADGDVAVAKHNLALLLREGKGAPRDGRKAIDLLRSAARQGMSASMFALGDIYARGDAAPEDVPKALAWFAITVEFERRTHRGSETPLSKTAQQRLETLQSALKPAELERAEMLGQGEYRQILAALNPSKNDPLPPARSSIPSVSSPTPAPATPQSPPSPPADAPASWPRTPTDQVRAVQQALIDLHRLNGKADGVAGPATRAAIREFEKSAGLRQTGEVSRDIHVALLGALARRDTVTESPLPPPPRVEVPPPRSDLDTWPAKERDQIRAIQSLLGELKLMRAAPTGQTGPITIAAIREYQRMAGLRQTGEPSKELFESLKEMRSHTMARPADKPD